MSRLALVPLILLAACAAAPKPPELEAFERIRQSALVEPAQKRAPQLVDDAEQLFQKSTREWQKKDLYESRRDALMGSILLKTAVALVEQDQANARMKQIGGEQRKSDEEIARLTKELSALTEQIALLEKLRDAKSASAAKDAKLAEEQQRASARDKVAAAELALKNADMYDAKQHAAAEYTSAGDMLSRAQLELKQGNFAAAATSAEMAKQKADSAAVSAKPKYEANEAALGDKARNEALSRDAAAISGVAVRIEKRGEMQRLVLPLKGMFSKRSTAITPGRDSSLDALAELLKKYPNYPVQVIGHTDSRGKHLELVALSQARAQSVYSGLVTRGVDSKRMTVSGMGPDEPIAPNKGTAREQNNRVEVILVY
jgi:outer membrane protein OmpA-like peptidoglycan-associated protein